MCGLGVSINIKLAEKHLKISAENEFNLAQLKLFSSWYATEYNFYKVNPVAISELKPLLKGITITLLMGTWCEDSQREVSPMMKILETAGYPIESIEIIAVSEDKDTPNGIEKPFDLFNVPTLIFIKDGKEMNRVAQENVLNALSGKMAGVTISSTGGTGSSVSVVIRGAKSLSSDNQPLFVIDGVPIANTLNNISQVGNDHRADFGNSISGLHPDDIELFMDDEGFQEGLKASHQAVSLTAATGANAAPRSGSVH